MMKISGSFTLPTAFPNRIALKKGINTTRRSGFCKPEKFYRKRHVTKVLCWQSKVGPQQTNGSPHPRPMSSRNQTKAILMVPIATTDHIETLDGIDIEFRGYANEVVDHFARVDCFNMEESSSTCVLDS